jgi:hypothetical protein
MEVIEQWHDFTPSLNDLRSDRYRRRALSAGELLLVRVARNDVGPVARLVMLKEEQPLVLLARQPV